LILLFARHSVLDNATNDQWLVSLLILDIVGLFYHVWAMVDAYLVARPKKSSQLPRKWAASAAIIVLISGTVGIHAVIAAEDLTLRNTAYCLHSPIPCWMLNGNTATDDPGATPFSGDGNDDVIGPGPSDSPSPDDSTPTATDTSSPYTPGSAPPGTLPDVQTTQNSQNWAKDGRLNVLLVGVDQAPGRSDFLTDTMILLQVDLATGRSAMYGLARNLYCIPMPKQIAAHYPNPKPQYGCPAGMYGNDMLNGLWYEAAYRHPSYFPFYQGKDAVNTYMRGIMALEQGIGTLTGVTVDGTVLINLPGFSRLVDDLGGIDINVPTKEADYPCGPKGTWAAKWRVCDVCPGCKVGDPRKIHNGYSVSDGTGAVVAQMKTDATKSGGKQTITYKQSGGPNIGFVILAGQQHMDGEWALAYARTRIYSSDYDRMKRQQTVIQTIRNNVEPCAILPRLLPPSSLLSDLGQAFWTDMPTDGSTLTTLAGLAHNITGSNVQRFSLDPGTLHSPSKTTMITVDGWATARAIVAHGLDSAPAATSGTGNGGNGGGSHC
jgi:anionic cell wall polymer biosynthesis LytR-Cps2A-Psr (LCP) family protein